MTLSDFTYYSKVAKYETSFNQEYNDALFLVNKIKDCENILQVKTLLNKEFGESNIVNKSIGNLGYISTSTNEDYFEVSVEYSNQVHICIFPILETNNKENENDNN